MKCNDGVGPPARTCVRKQLVRAESILSIACLIFLGGCASTASLQRESLRASAGLTNAFSRALTFATERTRSKSVDRSKQSPGNVTTFASFPDDSDDPRVRKFLRYYAYEQRETTKKYLAGAQRYLPMVREICKEQHLPEEIAYLFMLESGANPEARSPANALGMWQFMPATARSYGLRVDSSVDERLDPRKSTKAAMLYLKDLYGMFGCWRLALSAYNSGENKLNQVLCAEDASEYDEICSSRKLGRETREFFPRFLALAIIAKNPKKYGFAPMREHAPREEFETVSIEGNYDLGDLAWAIGVPHKQLVDLNPELLRGVTPSGGPPFRLKVPKGKQELLTKKLAHIPRQGDQQHVVHIVNKGDNLAKILKRYQVSRSQLANLNPDVNLRRSLRRGDKLVVPVTQKSGVKKQRKAKHLSSLQ